MEDNIMANSPISISDATSMLRRQVQPNDRPYDRILIKLNNRMVDEWEDKVVKVVADSHGNLPAGRVWHSWQLFLEGKELTKRHQLQEEGWVSEFPIELVDFWRVFFETKSTEEMHVYGPGVVSYGWGVIEHYMKTWYAEQKWESIYSQYPDDPLAWEKNYFKCSDVIFGKVLPFWTEEQMKDIKFKVGSILFNVISPNDEEGISLDRLKRDVQPNDRPYVKITTRLNNKLVDEWGDGVLNKSDFKTPKQCYLSWQIFYEGRGLVEYQRFKEEGNIHAVSEELVEFWKEFFKTKPVEEMHSFGTGVISYGWSVLQHFIQTWCSDQKWKNIYSVSDDPMEWERLAWEHTDITFGEILPFWTENELKTIQMKVCSVLGNTVQPQGSSSFN